MHRSPRSLVCVCALLTLIACGDIQEPASESAEPAPEDVAEPAMSDDCDVPWSYEGETGPSFWGELSTCYAACSEGVAQSPIELTTQTPPEELPPLVFDYRPSALRVRNTGKTVEVAYDAGSTLKVGEASYELVQFHFHSPSEHTVDGEHAPLELHLVHQGQGDALAVVGVFFTEGEENAALAPIWASIPGEAGQEVEVAEAEVAAADLLPGYLASHRYDGSLTTPPCREGVRWLVLETPLEVSTEQIDAFRALFTPNNRPVQPLGERTVRRDHPPEE